MGGYQSEPGNGSPAADEGQSSARRVGPTISATPDDGQRQWNWLEDSARHRARIVHLGDYAFPLFKAATNKESGTHYAKEPKSNPSLSRITDEMKDSNRGDIFAADLHVIYSSVNGRTEPVGISNTEHLKQPFIYVADMLVALNDGESPSAVVICGCNSALLLDNIINFTKVFVAIGVGIQDDVTAELNVVGKARSVDSIAATDAITASLVREDSIDSAVKAGDAAMKSAHNELPLVIVAKCREGVESELSLRKNNLLPKFRVALRK